MRNMPEDSATRGLSHSTPEKQPVVSHYVVRQNSVRLWTEMIGNSTRPAVLLIAGAGAHAHFWSDFLCQEIASAGFCVIRFDHRDTGYSSAVDYVTHPYTIADLAQDVLAILDAFHMCQAHCVGHSMGGLIAQLLACRYPERILTVSSLSVNALGTKSTVSEDIMQKLMENHPTDDFKESLAGFMRSWKILQGDIPLDEKMAEEYTRELYERSFHKVGVAWNHIRAQERIHEFSHELCKLKVPALFLHGEKDPLVPVEVAKSSFVHIKNATFEIVPKMGHMFFDRNVEKFLASRLVSHFLRT